MEKGDSADRYSRQTQETLIPSTDSSPKEKTSVLNEKEAQAAAVQPPPSAAVAPGAEPVPAPPRRSQSAWSRLTGRSASPVLPTTALPTGAPVHPVRSNGDTPIYVGGDHPHVIATMTRTLSHQPAAASLFGGVSPDAIDQEEGLVPVRSREEAEAREEERQKIAADPWAVKFEPGEKINPKVSTCTSRRLERTSPASTASVAHTCAVAISAGHTARVEQSCPLSWLNGSSRPRPSQQAS